MKKLFTAMAVAMLAAPSFVFAEGTVGLRSISPAQGEVKLDINESGLSAINFSFTAGKGEVARDKNLFITMTRNGSVISNVSSSNTAYIKYDDFLMDVWQVSFFGTRNHECMVAGDYQITIPEGFFVFGDETNKEVVLNYYIKNSSVTIYPPESRDMKFLQDFTITFGEAKTVEVNTAAEHGIEVYDVFGGAPDEAGEGEYGEDDTDYNLKYETSVTGNSLLIHLLEPVTKGSTYNIVIPSGAIYIYGEDGNQSQNKDLNYQYAIPKVGKGQPEIIYPGSLTLDFPGVIELNLAEGEKLLLVNEMGGNYLYPVNEDGTLGESIATFRAAKKNSHFYVDDNGDKIADNANKVFLVNQLGEDVRIVPTPGVYALVTSNSLYTVQNEGGGLLNVSSFSYSFEVVDGNLYDMEFTPKSGDTVENLQEIKVKFPDADELKVTWNTAWLKSATTAYQFFPQGGTDDNTVTFKANMPATMPGEYRFIANPGMVEVDGDFVGLYAEYKISESSDVREVSNVTVLPAVFDIFNAQGLVIKRNATVEDLNALPAGIYIAGGKKIVNRW